VSFEEFKEMLLSLSRIWEFWFAAAIELACVKLQLLPQ